MTLRKTTIDNSVKYIVKNDHSHVSNERDMGKRNASIDKLSQKTKTFIKNISEGFRIFKWITIFPNWKTHRYACSTDKNATSGDLRVQNEYLNENFFVRFPKILLMKVNGC